MTVEIEFDLSPKKGSTGNGFEGNSRHTRQDEK